MVKNIILDIGGVFFDDSKNNIERLLNKNCDDIYKIAYGKGFKRCLLGEISVEEHINNLRDEINFKDIKYILEKDNLIESYPLIKNNFEYIKKLKERGFNLYLLTNITEDSYHYINDLININEIFDGGIYSYQEHLIKPDCNIYNLLVNRFNLDKNETIFFDDKKKNVDSANSVGIKSFVFTSIEDIECNLIRLEKENNMAQIIEINVENNEFKIEWALSEYFGELKGKRFMINEMAADQIETIDNLSSTAKLLLSAVAGAVIQHLIDNNCKIDSIFECGYFIIK